MIPKILHKAKREGGTVARFKVKVPSDSALPNKKDDMPYFITQFYTMARDSRCRNGETHRSHGSSTADSVLIVGIGLAFHCYELRSTIDGFDKVFVSSTMTATSYCSCNRFAYYFKAIMSLLIFIETY